mmetsp:Transcript_24089/g.47841  ORF Transcript_24089/g.47841 Transcript_24089/m.47841 type:complete len:93 (+) Transcript_24089:693-971(+)
MTNKSGTTVRTKEMTNGSAVKKPPRKGMILTAPQRPALMTSPAFQKFINVCRNAAVRIGLGSASKIAGTKLCAAWLNDSAAGYRQNQMDIIT